MPDSIAHTYQLIVLFLGIALIISTLEYLSILSEFGSQGLFSWKILKLSLGRPLKSGIMQAISRLVYSQRGVGTLMSIRLVGIMLMLYAAATMPGSLLFSVALGLVVLTILIFGFSHHIGNDGSDQMSVILAITVFVCVGPHSNTLLYNVGLWFIALQSCLAYMAAGLAKLISPQWRGGDAVYKIFSTGTYGAGIAHRLLTSRKVLNLLLCWAVILMETLFPLTLLLPEPFIWLFLVWGVIFHALNAIIMGLNTFLWAFLATYPAILYVSSQLPDLFSINGR